MKYIHHPTCSNRQKILFSSDSSNEEVVESSPSNGYHVRDIDPPAASGLLCYRRIKTHEKPVPGAGRRAVPWWPRAREPSVSEGCLPSDQKEQENRLRAQVQVRDHSPGTATRLITNVAPLRRLTLNRYTDPALGVQQSVAVVKTKFKFHVQRKERKRKTRPSIKPQEKRSNIIF